jgi:hypothetical protein
MWEAKTPRFVIAGLDTAGRVYPTCGTRQCETRACPSFDAIHRTEEKPICSMDARVKPAHDDSWILGFVISACGRLIGMQAIEPNEE